MARRAAFLKSSILHEMATRNHLVTEFGQNSEKFCHPDATFLADNLDNGRNTNN